MRLGFLLMLCGWLCAQEPVAGLPPRTKADDYAAKAKNGNLTLAASVVPARQVKKMFAFDISDAYVVLEVASYPDSGKPSQVLRDDFVVKGRTHGELTHQVEAETVASVTQQKNLPKPPSNRPDVAVGATVGYESGADPVTGQKVHGVYTSAGVGVGLGNDRLPRTPTPGGYPQDRDLLEAQLRARSLPEGKIEHNVAGYLFFPRAGMKAQADGTYALRYLGPNSQEAQLSVPR